MATQALSRDSEQRLSISVVVGLACLGFGGCNKANAPAVSGPDVDPSTAAAAAMESYDANADGAIDKSELAKCPPLAQALAAYDADANGQLTAEEITERLTRLFGVGSSLTSATFTVTVAGRPLSGATVTLRPVEMLGDGVQAAEGVTDESGVARPSIAAEKLPTNLQAEPLMQPGLYYVAIAHPQQSIPARYNSATELSFELDPMSRQGKSAKFDLKAK